MKEMLAEYEQNIEDSICYEIRLFPFLHNGAYPKRIFVSKPLFDILEATRKMRFFNNDVTSKNNIKTIFGVIIEVYEGEEIEFYLAERKGAFRKR